MQDLISMFDRLMIVAARNKDVFVGILDRLFLAAWLCVIAVLLFFKMDRFGFRDIDPKQPGLWCIIAYPVYKLVHSYLNGRQQK